VQRLVQSGARSRELLRLQLARGRIINPDLQRFMAKRMGAKTIELKSSHLSMISHPEAITNLILKRPRSDPQASSQ